MFCEGRVWEEVGGIFGVGRMVQDLCDENVEYCTQYVFDSLYACAHIGSNLMACLQMQITFSFVLPDALVMFVIQRVGVASTLFC